MLPALWLRLFRENARTLVSPVDQTSGEHMVRDPDGGHADLLTSPASPIRCLGEHLERRGGGARLRGGPPPPTPDPRPPPALGRALILLELLPSPAETHRALLDCVERPCWLV
ncbi:hypothetical protein AAFF_G00265920 [Aldrovandia affinis]|uniref:Uncharacterized protein n=1 Tax=Aldrovandia affinis TaxID=143900 RepID=A0AAD7RBB7_9TELE|nr:hypothetical protein AAFF_G00265920 [Aldrovandia affinis]